MSVEITASAPLHDEPRDLEILDEMMSGKVSPRQEAKANRSKQELLDLRHADKIVRRVMGHVASIGEVIPLEGITERGSYSDSAIAIATDRLRKPHGIEIEVQSVDPEGNKSYDAVHTGDMLQPHRAVVVIGINENANRTPTSHRR